MENKIKYVAYCRVSTQMQGLGLDAQEAIIKNYIATNGGELVEVVTEKESGKETTNRPRLQYAIQQVKAINGMLIVAKLDRLSRDVADIFALKKTGLSFAVCDMDSRDTLMLGIFATLAQKERELISRRTKEALQAKKAQGCKLGNPNATEHMRAINEKGWKKRKELAKTAVESRHAYNAIRFMSGTLREKAEFLNAEGYRTRNGKTFAPMTVKRILEMYDKNETGCNIATI